MKEGLNLLPSVAKFQATKIKLKRKINLIMIVVFGGWTLVIAAIFGIWAFSSYSLNKAKSKNDSALKQYKTLVESVVLSVKNKHQAKVVKKVLAERFEYGSSIRAVREMFSENVVISNLEINSNKNYIVSGYLRNAVNMSEVESIIKDISMGYMPEFKSAKLLSLEVTPSGWLFALQLELL